MKKDLNFNYLLIPMELIQDKKLQPLDHLVYGVIYAASQLSQKRCFLSNQGIADTIGSTPKTVGNSLNRLSDTRAIHRVFADAQKRKRLEIIPLIQFGKIAFNPTKRVPSGDGTLPSGDGTPFHQVMEHVPSVDGQSNNIKKEEGVRIINRENFPKNDPEKDRESDQGLAEVTNLFKELFPSEFIGRKAFAKMPTRNAVGDLMQIRSYEEIKRLTVGYQLRKMEKFAPSVGDIVEFCTYKFPKIEQFLGKSKRGDSPHFRDMGAKNNYSSQKEKDLAESIAKKIKDKKGK